MIKLFLLLFLLCVSARAQTATYPAGESPQGLAFDGSNIWVANYLDPGKVTKLRASDGSMLGQFTVGALPHGVVFDGQNMWITNVGSYNVTKVRTADGTAIGTFFVGTPGAILFDGANIWVTNFFSTVTKLRPSDGSTLGTYPTGGSQGANGVGMAFEGTNVWITDPGLNNAIKMRASDGAVLGTFSTGGNAPFGVAFDGTNMWVANSGSNTLAKLRPTDGTLLGTFATGASPGAVLFDGQNIWVTNQGDNTVMKLRPTDGKVLAIMPTGLGPAGIAFDGANIWVTNSSGVTKINALSVSTSIATSVPNLTLQLDGVNSSTPAAPNWTVGSSHQIGVSSPQTLGSSRYVFSHWSDGGAQTHSIIVQPSAYTAFFDSQYLLQRVASPVGSGTISAAPGSPDGFYNADMSVQLIAQPSPGYVFSGFTGDVSGATSPQTIAMDRPRSVTANFNIINCTYSLNPSSAAVGSQSSTGTVALTSGAGCQWIAGSNASWITLTSPTSGSGPTTVSFSVAANPNTISRTGTINIAGQLFTITQSATPTSPQTGLRFVPLPPCRLMETRPEYNFQGRTGPFGPPFMASNETRTLTPANSNVCQVPAAAKAYVLNVTLVPRGNVDFVTIWPAGDPRPDVWTIRSPDGNTVANSTIVKAGTGSSISVYASNATDLLLDISGYFTDTTAISNLVYYPLAPCRVIDTRTVYRLPGPFGPPSMGAQETRRFRFPATPYCQVPTGAAAYSMTITAVPQGPLQFLTAWPDGPPQLTVSTINSPAGRILANSAIVPASTDGSINVFTFNQSDVLFDITGYFAPDDGTNGLVYFPVTQCRVSDSTISGGIYADDTARTIAIPSAAGCAGIPANARAYAVNVTALPGGNPMPFLTAYPTGQSRPGASILNAFEGQIVTNSAIVPAGANGAIDVYAYRATHVVVEISGYFGR